MKKFIKRNQLIITILALLIAVAGYLNYADNKLVKNKDSTTKEVSKEEPKDAVLVNGNTVAVQAKISREQTRANIKDSLMTIINNKELTEENKSEAVKKMVNLNELCEKENAAETMLESKGFTSCVVSITDGKVDVSVPLSEISDEQKAQIEDVIKRKTEIGIENIVISPISAE